MMPKQRDLCLAAAALLAIFLGSPGLTALADEAPYEAVDDGRIADGEPYEAVDGGRIPDEQLLDDTVEYGELGSLIHSFNDTVREISASVENQRKDYTEVQDSLRAEKNAARQEKEDAEDEGDMDSYAENAGLEAIYKSAMASYNQILKNLNGHSVNKSRINVEKQLTSAAQSLMISWESVSLNKEYLEKLSGLQEELYRTALLEKEAGLSTELDAESAYNSWKEAEASLSALSDTESSLYQSLCILLGQKTDGSIEIASIPSVDESRLEDLDLERDTADALMYNLELVEKKLASGGDSDGITQKNLSIKELEDTITRKMKTLYQEIWLSKDTKEAAETGYESARLNWENARTKYELGMLSKAEYLQAELQYIQKENEVKTAKLELFQALETYDWAKKGILS